LKYFLDFEFNPNDDTTITIISLGMIKENFETLYCISNEFKEENCNKWVQKNVLPNLGGTPRISLCDMKQQVINFISDDPKPEFWGYFCAFDWVLFCQLFGGMLCLPKYYPMLCKDVEQYRDKLQVELSPNNNNHNALQDAIWTMNAYNYLDSIDNRY